MGNELLVLRGRLAVNEGLIRDLTCGIDVNIDELRSMLDKYTPKTELRSDRIALVSAELVCSIDKLKTLTAIIAEIKRDLGL
jgi:hypothetical protein